MLWTMFYQWMNTAISINVVGSKHKARRQDRKVIWDFFLNKFMKTSLPRPYSEDLWWRAIWMKEIPGYQVDEEAAVSRMASLEVRPYCRTRKHQWALFRSCVNWLVNLSSNEFDTNETSTWKYKIILFVLLFSITLTRLTSTEMAIAQ